MMPVNSSWQFGIRNSVPGRRISELNPGAQTSRRHDGSLGRCLVLWKDAALLLGLNCKTENRYRVAIVVGETARRAPNRIMLRRVAAKHPENSWYHDTGDA